MKKAVDTALAGLGDDSRNELQERMASAVSTALMKCWIEAVDGTDAPIIAGGRLICSEKSSGGWPSFPRSG